MHHDLGHPAFTLVLGEEPHLRWKTYTRTIAQVLEDSTDHPDVEELYARASSADPRISLATVYRTVKLFEEAGILDKLEFGDGRARYEDAERDHHDHLIDMDTGNVIEFCDPRIEEIIRTACELNNFSPSHHSLYIYGRSRSGNDGDK